MKFVCEEFIESNCYYIKLNYSNGNVVSILDFIADGINITSVELRKEIRLFDMYVKVGTYIYGYKESIEKLVDYLNEKYGLILTLMEDV